MTSYSIIHGKCRNNNKIACVTTKEQVENFIHKNYKILDNSYTFESPYKHEYIKVASDIKKNENSWGCNMNSFNDIVVEKKNDLYECSILNIKTKGVFPVNNTDFYLTPVMCDDDMNWLINADYTLCEPSYTKFNFIYGYLCENTLSSQKFMTHENECLNMCIRTKKCVSVNFHNNHCVLSNTNQIIFNNFSTFHSCFIKEYH